MKTDQALGLIQNFDVSLNQSLQWAGYRKRRHEGHIKSGKYQPVLSLSRKERNNKITWENNLDEELNKTGAILNKPDIVITT